MSATNSNQSSPVLSPVFYLSSHLDKEQRVWAVDLQAMITEKRKLGSRETNRKILAETFACTALLPGQGVPLPLLGSGRVKEDVSGGIQLAPRSGPWILSFLFNTIIQSPALLSGRWEPGKFVGALRAWGSISVISVDLGC